jgi:hypothetical protein
MVYALWNFSPQAYLTTFSKWQSQKDVSNEALYFTTHTHTLETPLVYVQ